jgi:hypothetical protein
MKGISRSLVAIAALATMFPANAAVIPLAPDGVWHTQDVILTAPDFFPDTYRATVNETVRVTDFLIENDDFDIFVNSVVRATTFHTDWPAFPAADPFVSPPFEPDPATAFASGNFGTAVFTVNAGDIISIEDIHIPPSDVGGPPFPDGTVAISAVSAVPEPASIAVLGVGLCLIGLILCTTPRLRTRPTMRAVG